MAHDPKPLGKYETGSKTAPLLFKSFIESAIKKSETRPFKAAKGTVMMVVDPNTDKATTSKNTIIEVFKDNIKEGKTLLKFR